MKTYLPRHRRVAIGLAMLWVATAGHAASSLSVGLDQCSGSRSTTEAAEYRIECSDNFSLSNGSITSDLKVVISGVASLTISNVTITAPAIELRSDGSVSLGSGTELRTDAPAIGPALGTVSPPLSTASGVTISLGGAPAAPIVSSGTLLLGSVAPVPDAASAPSIAASESGGGGALGLHESAMLALALAALGLAARRKR